MCGIAGIFNFNNEQVRLEQLLDMTNRMVERGPDDDGFYISESESLGLGFRRLSIIDVEGGHQPLTNEDESLYLIFNGEIYNHVELRADLVSRGHVFKTKSDAEVLIHLYEEKGVKALDDLNGMFAFALYDSKLDKLFLARDRLGIKPLFFAKSSSKFVFASDLRALNSQFESTINEDAVIDYLALAYVSKTKSMFNGVNKLLPGHMMVVDVSGSMEISNYWSPGLAPKWEGSITEAKNRLEYLIGDAVKLQMRSDVPVGLFLSGGVDSSALLAFASQLTSEPLRTFTIKFSGKDSSDASMAKMLAEKYKTKHVEIEVDAAYLLRAMEELVPLLDEPISDSAIFPAYILSKTAAEHGVKVLLNGAGADEIFGGYSRHWPASAGSPTWLADKLHPFISKIVGSSIRFLAPSRGWRIISRANAWTASVAGTNVPLLEKLFRDSEKSKILLKQINAEHGEVNFLRDHSNYSYPRMKHDLVTYLPNDVLALTDKASMAASVECRVPLLDHRLVEFAYSLPADFNMLNDKPKGLFKDVLSKFLPKAILNKRKEGFNAPIMDWHAGDLSSKIKNELLNEPAPLIGLLFSEKELTKLLNNSRVSYLNGESIFSIFFLSMWSRLHVKSESVN